MTIRENVRAIADALPPGVELVAAAKSQPVDRVQDAIDAGVRTIGENYVQEAEAHFAAIGGRVAWHFIGHLQKNKARKAAPIFDMIETLDSAELAVELDKRCGLLGRTIAALIEINSGREPQKFGVFPERAEALVREVAGLANVRILGLMTMGPFEGDPENARPYFRETKKTFDALAALGIPGIAMTILSMGMTNSYRVAIEEGATMVRIGTKIFGPRS